MNTLANTNGNAVGAVDTNFFQSYGDAASQKTIIGKLLKFNKGDWLAGEDEEEIENGTKFVANMDELMVGWIRWFDKKPTDTIMGRIAEGYQPPKRQDLGDADKGEWEEDKDGRPQDPWALTNYLILKNEDDNDLFTFTTSSKAGLSAIGELCKSFGKAMRQRPAEYPIIEIGSSAYTHKEYGRIKTPTFKIVGWTEKAPFQALLEGEQTTDNDDDTSADQTSAAPAASGKGKKSPAAGATRF